jgi:hypothetical protein
MRSSQAIENGWLLLRMLRDSVATPSLRTQAPAPYRFRASDEWVTQRLSQPDPRAPRPPRLSLVTRRGGAGSTSPAISHRCLRDSCPVTLASTHPSRDRRIHPLPDLQNQERRPSCISPPKQLRPVFQGVIGHLNRFTVRSVIIMDIS